MKYAKPKLTKERISAAIGSGPGTIGDSQAAPNVPTVNTNLS